MFFRADFAVRRLLPGLIFIGFLALYVLTASRGFIVGSGSESESMELQRAVVYNGIGHSTGYPAYTLSAHLFTRIGAALGGDPFTWATYYSSFTTALALLVTYFLLRLWFSAAASTVATVLFGLSGVVWHIATITEVQGLHLLTVVGILYLAALYRRYPDRTWLLEGIALLFGVGLANHRIIVLLASGVALVVLSAQFWRYLKSWYYLRIAAMGALPLLTYFYIFVAASAPTVYGLGLARDHLNSPYSVVQLVFGYGQEGLLQLTSAELGARFSFVAGYHLDFLTPLGVGLGLAGLLVFARRAPIYALALAGTGLTSLLFFMAWRQDHKSFIYYGQTEIVLIVGLAALANVVFRIPRLPNLRIGLAAPLAVLIPFLFAVQAPLNNRAQDRTGQIYYDAYLSLPQNSVVFTGGWCPDHWIGLEAAIKRPDLRLQYVRDDLNLILNAGRSKTDSVYLTWWMQMYLGMFRGAQPIPEAGLALSATGTPFVQVRPRGDERLVAEAERASRIDQIIAPGVRLLGYTTTPQADAMLFTLYWQAEQQIGQTYRPFTHLRQVDGAGNPVALLSQRDYPNPVLGLYPTRFWQAGEVIKDTYAIPWPKAPLPAPENLRWAFGLTSETGERLGEVNLAFTAGPPK